MHMRRLRHEVRADEQQKRQRQHLHRRVLLHKPADPIHRQNHDSGADEHREHHHRHEVRHTDGRHDAVEAEDDVHKHDLQHHRSEAGGGAQAMIAFGTIALAFELVVNLPHRLPEQKESADEQHEILAADGQRSRHDRRLAFMRHRLLKRPRNAEHRFAQSENVAQQHQKNQPRDHREQQSLLPRRRALLRRQLAREDGNEDDVVHAEHDLQRHEREQSDPGGAAGGPGEVSELLPDVHVVQLRSSGFSGKRSHPRPGLRSAGMAGDARAAR